jgi:hypothetical protein
MKKRTSLALWIAVIAIAACSTEPGPDPDPGPAFSLVNDMLPQDVIDVDLLFVIDNSGSMHEEQQSLIQWAQQSLFGVLEVELEARPNLHVAVVSTDMGTGPYSISGCEGNGDNGAMWNQPQNPSCTAPTDSYLIDLDDGQGGRTTNYTGTLEEAFACVAPIGISGCGFEQPLESMKRALDGSVAANDGFLRQDALLAVVIVSDEDDCSTFDNAMFDTAQNDLNSQLGPLSSFRCFEFGIECAGDDPRTPGVKTDCVPRVGSPYMNDIDQYADFLKGLKNDPSMVIVGGIFGEADQVEVQISNNDMPELAPGCSSPNGSAHPGVRLQAFLDQFPNRNRFASICSDAMSGPLETNARKIGGVAGRSPCLEGAIADTDAAAAGIQAECRVYEAPAGATRSERTELGAADFDIVAAPACAHASGLAVSLNTTPTPGAHIQVECRTE